MECDLPQFFNVKEPIARKQYHCCECRAKIEPGEKYVYCIGKWDGDLSTYRQHLLCANACRHIRDESDGECIAFGGLKEHMGEMYWHNGAIKRRPNHAILRKMYVDILRRERREKPTAGDSARRGKP